MLHQPFETYLATSQQSFYAIPPFLRSLIFFLTMLQAIHSHWQEYLGVVEYVESQVEIPLRLKSQGKLVNS